MSTNHRFRLWNQGSEQAAYRTEVGRLLFLPVNVYERRVVNRNNGCISNLLVAIAKVFRQCRPVVEHSQKEETGHLKSKEHNHGGSNGFNLVLEILEAHLHFRFVWIAKATFSIQRGTLYKVGFVETYASEFAFNFLNDIPRRRFRSER